MALTLTEDETLLVEAVGTMLDQSAPVEAFRAMRDEGGAQRFDANLWLEMAGMGLAAIARADEDEDSLGFSGAALVMEAAGRHLAASPLASALIAADLLANAGRGDLATQVNDADQLIAVALADPNLADDTGSGLAISPQETVEGLLSLVPDGSRADGVIVLATHGDEARLLLLDLSLPGITRKPFDLVDHRDYCSLACTGVPLANTVELARGDAALALVHHARDIGALLCSAELLGIAGECFDRTIEYLKTREQFGVLIGTFQALQHRAARLYIDLELARGVLRKAMRAIDAGADDASLLISHAKYRLGATACRTVDEAIQMHGGIGVTDELDIGLFLKRARVLDSLYGDRYAHRERLAVERFDLPPA
jgi:alkylation response protein AidB-like acyl-CoA dehydrogenase